MEKKVTKKELAEVLSEKYGYTKKEANEVVTTLLDEVADIFKILLAILVTISFMVIIGTTLLIKMSNAGMMFR